MSTFFLFFPFPSRCPERMLNGNLTPEESRLIFLMETPGPATLNRSVRENSSPSPIANRMTLLGVGPDPSLVPRTCGQCLWV